MAPVATGPRQGSALTPRCERALCGGRVAVTLETCGQPPQGDQPTDWRAPSQETALTTSIPPGARGTMAVGPRRCWCTYRRRCGNAGTAVSTRRRAHPAGDRPEEWRAPTQGLEGTNPRTGRRHFFLTRSGSTVCPNCSWLTCPRSYVEFYSGLGAWFSCAYLCTPGFFLFFSLASASSFGVFWWLSFSVQTDSNTRGRTTSTGALQYHCVGQSLQGSALPLSAHFRALWYGSSEGIFRGIWLASRKLVSPSRVPASLF